MEEAKRRKREAADQMGGKHSCCWEKEWERKGKG